MKILLVAATTMEIAPVVSANISKVDVLITGVGAPSCLYLLTKKLHTKSYDLVLQAGIAGTFKNSFAPGETFAVKTDCFADLGIEEKNEFFTLFDKGFARGNDVPYTNGMLVNSLAQNFPFPLVNAITINTVTDRFEQSALLQKKYDADIESMEGAAFHYVCLMEGVPFLQLRSISNFVGERLKTNWKIKESVESLNKNLKKIITQL